MKWKATKSKSDNRLQRKEDFLGMGQGKTAVRKEVRTNYNAQTDSRRVEVVNITGDKWTDLFSHL